MTIVAYLKTNHKKKCKQNVQPVFSFIFATDGTMKIRAVIWEVQDVPDDMRRPRRLPPCLALCTPQVWPKHGPTFSIFARLEQEIRVDKWRYVSIDPEHLLKI